MNTGKGSRSEEESALKINVTGEIVHEEEEVSSDSEDEIFAFFAQAMRRVHTKKDPSDYICYHCKEKGSSC